MKNNATKHILKQRKRLSLADTHVSTDEGIVSRIIELEISSEISEAIASLPSEQRRIILSSIAGLTVEQVAIDLGVSVNTVKTQKKRAYQALRKSLKDLYPVFMLLV